MALSVPGRRLVLLLVGLFPFVALAIPPLLSVEARVRQADVVVRGKVAVAHTVSIGADAEYALFEVEVLEGLKGNVGDGVRPGSSPVVILVHPLRLGGADVRQPELGSEYVLFLDVAGAYLYAPSAPDGSPGWMKPSDHLLRQVRSSLRK